jgi:hypothetical protein
VPAPSPADHSPAPQVGTVYSWAGLVSDGVTLSDFPLNAMCAICGLPVIRREWGASWEHRPPGEWTNEPATGF